MLTFKLKKQLETFVLDVDSAIGNKELLVVLGPSGCGKTTLLDCIAGFGSVDSGHIELNKAVFCSTDKGIKRPIHERHVAYIQQECHLFPHLNVQENVLYSVKKGARRSAEQDYQTYMKRLGIEHLEKRSVTTLSGGEQQRVAIARALMMNPKLMLWDEPFSALDYGTRESLRALVLELKEALGIPMIFVTHDLTEAYVLADRLAVMAAGKFLQCDGAREVFDRPATKAVADILGITKKSTAMGDAHKKEQKPISSQIFRRIDKKALSAIEHYFAKRKKVYQCPVIAFTGVSNGGKTWVVTELIRELRGSGLRVATIKHHGHGVDIDQPGKDTHLHHEAGACAVTMATLKGYATFVSTPDKEAELDALIEAHGDVDVILVEGYKFSDVPKFEVLPISQEGVCREGSLMGYITSMGSEGQSSRKPKEQKGRSSRNTKSLEHGGQSSRYPTFGFDEMATVAQVIRAIKERVDNERQ